MTLSWYRTGTVTVATGSKNVTGVGTLWASSVNVGDAFALVDANGNPTGAWYEVEAVTSNTALVLKQTYTGTPAPGSNKQYAVFNLVGNMTTPSFAQRLAQFFDQFQNLVDLPTTTPTAASIPIAGAGGTLDAGWLPAATTSVAGAALVPTNLYARSANFSRASANTLSTPAINVEVNGALLSFPAGSIGLNTAGNWDTAGFATPATRAGKDCYVYATATKLVLSANSTIPTGYTAANSRKIGGFHCLCVAVGTISGHPLSGFLAGDILPASAWDLNHRPICSPEGMVWSASAGIWVDIYLQSGTGTNTKSVNGGTITHTRNWMDFVDDLGAVGKRLLDDGEFQRIAAGGNEETNITGSASQATCGGKVDTAGRRMISNIGCEECAGHRYQWLLDQSYRVGTGAEWNWYDLPGDKGSLYNYSTDGTADVKLFAGGGWHSGASCGSRCRSAAHYRWFVNSSLGARGCCGAMFG